jgi:hypothetical protein
MKNFLFISLLCVFFPYQSFSQTVHGWKNFEFLSIYGGFPFSKDLITKNIFSMEFLRFSTSFRQASPIQKFGIGTELFDMNIYGKDDNGSVTLFPLILHYIPWMRFETYAYQPIKRTTPGPYGKDKIYYYDPDETNYEGGVSSSLEFTLKSTLWGLADDITKPDGTTKRQWNKKYFILRTAYVYNLRSKKKGEMGVSNGFGFKMSAEINNYLIFENGKAIYAPHVGIRLVMGILEIN